MKVVAAAVTVVVTTNRRAPQWWPRRYGTSVRGGGDLIKFSDALVVSGPENGLKN